MPQFPAGGPMGQGFGQGPDGGTQMMGTRTGGGTGDRAGAGRTGTIGGRMMGGPATVGEVLNLDDGSLTIKAKDGSSKIVILNDTTSFTTASTVAKSDIQVGATVSAFGIPNADGSLTATGIQLTK